MKEITKLYVVKRFIPGNLFVCGRTTVWDLTTYWVHEPHRRWELVKEITSYPNVAEWWVE